MSTSCQHYFCYSICKPNMVTFATQFASQIWLLLLLNLQAKYGWSDTSVDVLFKWVTSWNLWTKVASFLLKMPSNSLVAWLGFFVCMLLKDKMLPPWNTFHGSHRDAKRFWQLLGCRVSSSIHVRTIVFYLRARQKNCYIVPSVGSLDIGKIFKELAHPRR
jgi:hypothetical protein